MFIKESKIIDSGKEKPAGDTSFTEMTVSARPKSLLAVPPALHAIGEAMADAARGQFSSSDYAIRLSCTTQRYCVGESEIISATVLRLSPMKVLGLKLPMVTKEAILEISLFVRDVPRTDMHADSFLFRATDPGAHRVMYSIASTLEEFIVERALEHLRPRYKPTFEIVRSL